MKIKNKETGEIGYLKEIDLNVGGLRIVNANNDTVAECKSLAELNAEWGDYEEPRYIWWLDNEGGVNHAPSELDDNFKKNKEIGNYFSSREEAELAVRKLKAWKLLKDESNIKFNGLIRDDRAMLKGVKLIYDRHEVTLDKRRECVDALHLLFGGEE